MKKYLQPTLLLLLFASFVVAQSALDGTSFQASTYNLPDSLGVVRLIDGDGTNCRVEGGPNGDDKPTEEACLTIDSGGTPVTVTFGAGPTPVGDALVTATVTPFAGLPEGTIEVFNAANETRAPLDWSLEGDLIEITIRTADDSFPAEADDDFWGFSATGIQYPNALADSHVVLPFDEALDNYTNFYYWFEDKDGPIIDNYKIGLDVGLGIGRHPLDANREVSYPLYSDDQADEQTDTVAGGSLDFYSHGSVLDANPQIGNVLLLADNTLDPDEVDSLEVVTGFGLAILVQRPEMETGGVPGDFNDDQLLTAIDIDLLSMQVGGDDLTYDLNMDDAVTDADRTTWMDLANTLPGDNDLNGIVEFSDFLSLSGSFGKDGGWAEGDADGSGDVQFADFLLLSGNFGKSADAAAASVPEPSTGLLVVVGLAILGTRRRSRHATPIATAYCSLS